MFVKKIYIFIFLSVSLLLLSCSKEEEKETSIIQSNQPTANKSQQTSVTQFNLTVSAEQGGSVSTEGGTYDEGTEVTITATPSSDYIFSGWSSIRIKSTDPNTRYYRGGIYAHEFTHAISARPFLERADLSDITDWNSRMRSFHPCWIDEGTAHYAGLTVASRNKSEYFTQRINEIKGRQVEGFDPTNTLDVINQILNQNFYDCVGTPIYDAGYSVGLVIVETLSAISGPDSILMLWKLGSYGLEFSKAFQYLYGVSWEDAKPIIAEIVAKTSLDNK